MTSSVDERVAHRDRPGGSMHPTEEPVGWHIAGTLQNQVWHHGWWDTRWTPLVPVRQTVSFRLLPHLYRSLRGVS